MFGYQAEMDVVFFGWILLMPVALHVAAPPPCHFVVGFKVTAPSGLNILRFKSMTIMTERPNIGNYWIAFGKCKSFDISVSVDPIPSAQPCKCPAQSVRIL